MPPAGPRSPRKDKVQLLSVSRGPDWPRGVCVCVLSRTRGRKASLEQVGGGSGVPALPPRCVLSSRKSQNQSGHPTASSRLASFGGVQTWPALRLPSAWHASGMLGPARVAPGRFTEAGPGTGWGSEQLSLNERWLVSHAESGGAGSGSPGDTLEAGRVPSLAPQLRVGERHPLGPQSALGDPEHVESGDAASG